MVGGQYFWLLVLYSILLIAITSAIAARRHLWWDEIEVYYVATLPSLGAVWHALRSGVDWQPPTYYLPLYYLCKWFGASPLVMRSIAIFPYWLATLVLYITVARRSTPVHGFIAMLFPSFTLAFSYSFEARPYGLVLLFTACAFLAWELSHEERTRRLALVALPLSLGAAFAVHYNACLAAMPFVAGEIIRAIRRRGVDVPVLAAICCGAWPVFFLLPHVLTLGHFMAMPAGDSLLGRLLLAYQALFSYPMVIFLVACPMLAIWLAMRQTNNVSDYISAADFDALTLATSAAFLLIPIVFCAISHFTHTYYPRYVLETVIGVAIFLAMSLYGMNRAIPRLGGIVLAVLVIAVSAMAARRLRTPDENAWGTFARYSDLFDRNENALYGVSDPIVLGEGPYLLALRYGSENLRHRAFYAIKATATDAEPQAKYDGIFYRGLEPALPIPSHLTNYEEFKRDHPRFLLYNPDAWMLPQVLADGDEVKVQAVLANGPLYSVVIKQ